MLIGLGKRMGSDPDLLDGFTTGRCVVVAGRVIGKRGRPMNARNHEQQENSS